MVDLARKALAKAVRGKDKRGRAIHAYALAVALYERGRAFEAETVAKKGLPVARELELTAVAGNLLNMIANIELDDHRIDEAHEHYEQANGYLRQASFGRDAAIVIQNLGTVMWECERLEESLGHYDRAIDHLIEDDDRSMVMGLINRAGVYTELDRRRKAQKDLDAALALATRSVACSVHAVRAGLARLAEASGDLEGARAHYAETEMALDPAVKAIELGHTLLAAAGVEAETGDLSVAERLVERAAAMLDDRQQRPGMGALRAARELAIGRIEAARNEPAAARTRLDAIVRAKSSLIHRSAEVRRVAARLAAQLDDELPKPRRYKGTSDDWTGDLYVMGTTESIVTGRLWFADNFAQVTARGPATGAKHYLQGKLIDGGPDGPTTVRLEIEVGAKVLSGRMLDDDGEMFCFKWRGGEEV